MNSRYVGILFAALAVVAWVSYVHTLHTQPWFIILPLALTAASALAFLRRTPIGSL
jgi:hypothetical protein